MPLIIKEKELCEISINDPFFTDLKKTMQILKNGMKKNNCNTKKRM